MSAATLPPRTGPATPWNPSRRATARVTAPLPVPTECRHCGARVDLVSNSAVYGKPFGPWPWAFLCQNRDCGAYVGLHPFTGIPLGTLATRSIRNARLRAKAVFNPLWESKAMTRAEAYAWLAAELGIEDVQQCHIGWMDVAGCNRVVDAVLARSA